MSLSDPIDPMIALDARRQRLPPEDSPGPATVSAGQLLHAIRKRWMLLAAILLLGTGIGLGLSFLLTRRYEAEVVVMPRQVNQRGGGLLGSLKGQLGSLASLSGLNIGQSEEQAEAVAMLRSHLLARKLIRQDDLLPVIFSDDWSASAHRWIRRPRTINDGVRAFNRKIRSVVLNDRTGVVTVRIDWTNAEQAAAWANQLVALANERMREQAIAEAQSSIKFLKLQAKTVQTVEIRDALYGLMEEQYNNLLIANTTIQYALTVIDPAFAADRDQYVFPNHALFALGGLFFGLVIAGVVALVEAGKQPR